ncbi:hypothetical protein [Paraburkholderia adhaesiva]|uniref:hypothetical protein n=1 Tax=Paraburkholderia adhaesiva TaxID=2883244 RepID=UPI001F43DF79|nr:hypothetical protein [Paraburkholderia adhaesiva]
MKSPPAQPPRAVLLERRAIVPCRVLEFEARVADIDAADRGTCERRDAGPYAGPPAREHSR